MRAGLALYPVYFGQYYKLAVCNYRQQAQALTQLAADLFFCNPVIVSHRDQAHAFRFKAYRLNRAGDFTG